MKIAFSISYLIAFLSMVFFIQELHDWAHVLTADWLCGCFGTKTFDNWTTCDHCDVSGNITVLIWLAGPIITYVLVWLAWTLMNKRNSVEIRSLGFSLLFAANPFVNVFAAVAGGGDITKSMRMIFQRSDASNHKTVAVAALLLVLLLSIPPILRAINMVKGKTINIIFLLSFVLLPNYIKLFVVSRGMNFLLAKGIFQEEAFGGAPLLVLIWLFFVGILILVYYKSLLRLFKKKEKKVSLRI